MRPTSWIQVDEAYFVNSSRLGLLREFKFVWLHDKETFSTSILCTPQCVMAHSTLAKKTVGNWKSRKNSLYVCIHTYVHTYITLHHIHTYIRTHTYIHTHTYTGCPRRNVPDFGRVFLMLKYTDITQNTYVQSWTVTEIMAREKCGLLVGPCTVPVTWQPYPCPSLSVVSYYGNSAHARSILLMFSFLVIRQYTSVLGIHVLYSAWNTKDNYDMSASVFVVQFNGFMSLTS